MRGHVYKTQSFESLLEEKYIALTCAEYQGLKKYENAWAKPDREITDTASLLEATVALNFRATALYLSVSADGETVYRDKRVFGSTESVKTYTDGLKPEEALDVETLCQTLTELAMQGKKAKVCATVRVATGEVLPVAEFEVAGDCE